MAELTEEQKIIIGVCVGVAGLILLAIIIFICCVFYRKDHRYRRRRRPMKEKIIDRDYYYDRRPYTVHEKTVPPSYEPEYLPPPLPALPPPPPPPMPYPPMRREIYYKRPRSVEMLQYDDTWSEPPPKRYYSENRWDGVYRQEPIVVPLADTSEYVDNRELRREPVESDTIYLKYVDDQALLPRTNYVRRSEYAAPAPLRRSRSVREIRRTVQPTELRRSTPYVGDWYRKPDNLNQFNEYAMRSGRDPFLWQN